MSVKFGNFVATYDGYFYNLMVVEVGRIELAWSIMDILEPFSYYKMEFIIVDDSIFDQFTQEKLLLKSGLTKTVRTFGSAQEAMDHLREQDVDIPETVILLDLQMPGLNGFEFTEHYGLLPEAVRKRIRLFMISSTVDVSDIEQAEANPYIIQLLPKPLEIPLLIELLKK